MEENKILTSLNTFGIACYAKYFVEIFSVNEIIQLQKKSQFTELPHYILGGGSNILFTGNYDGLIIKVSIKGKEIIKETDEHIFLKIGAGENWHELVAYAINNGWGGIENLSLIPGQVGAAPVQNIGAYGVEVKDVFEELEAINLKTSNTEIFDRKACKFGYRDSVFKKEAKGKYIITAVVLKLNKKHRINAGYGAISKTLNEMGVVNPSIADVSRAVIQIRRSKLPDPKKTGNGGSFFKNPVISDAAYQALQANYPDIPGHPVDGQVKLAAAWLIDQCGWKGKRLGNVGVHENQALVLVNYGNGTGTEIKDLATKIMKDVSQKFSIDLEPEINIL